MKFNLDREKPLHQSESFLLKMGIVASSLAAASTPIANIANVLYFVLGFYISVSFPPLFGIIAILIGFQLYRLESIDRAKAIITLGLLGAVAGTYYGIATIS